MDDQRFGMALRATRVKRRLTQRDVALAAGLSDGSVSRVERGRLDSLSLRTLRAIAKVLDVRVELLPRSRAADLERVASAAHTTLAEAAIGWLAGFPGWTFRPEIGFSHFGDRGVIDVVGWHAASRALLVVELKTELVDINEILGTLNRYARNAATAVERLGWAPSTVSTLLIVGDSSHNRSRVHEHATLFSSALPRRIAGVRGWLRNPAGELSGLMFFANRHARSTNRRLVTVRRVRRVRRPRAAVPAPPPTLAERESSRSILR